MILLGMDKIPVIIDTDIAIASKYHDIDDLLAILVAINNPKLEILGITSVFGNTSLKTVNKGLIKLLNQDFIKQKLPHFSGTSISLKKIDIEGIKDKIIRGSVYPAVKFLYEQILQYESEVIIIPIGPLTNIALLFKIFPEVIDKIKRISLMGGKLNGWEFNYACDPLAFESVLSKSSDVNIDVLGLEVCTSLMFTKQHMEMLKKENTSMSKFTVKEINDWFKINNFIRGGFYPYDVLAVANVIKPDLFEGEKINYKDITFVNSKISLSRLNILSKIKYIKRDKGNINWIKGVDEQGLMNLLMKSI
jgi:inosine-uridine nucleoside N-ribohydrolase